VRIIIYIHITEALGLLAFLLLELSDGIRWKFDERDESLAINLPAADARIIADRALLHVVSVEVA